MNIVGDLRKFFEAGKTNEELLKMGYKRGTLYTQRYQWNKRKEDENKEPIKRERYEQR